jgi:hypothetical protein
MECAAEMLPRMMGNAAQRLNEAASSSSWELRKVTLPTAYDDTVDAWPCWDQAWRRFLAQAMTAT